MNLPNVFYDAAVLHRPAVRREHAAPVRRRCDDRNRVQNIRQMPRPRIRAADVTGQQRNDKVSILIYHKYSRVGILAAHERRNRPHGDARRADKHHRIRLRHAFFGKGTHRRIRQKAVRLRILLHRVRRQRRRERLADAAPAVGKRDDADVHLLASRQPCAKLGSYSLERS